MSNLVAWVSRAESILIACAPEVSNFTKLYSHFESKMPKKLVRYFFELVFSVIGLFEILNSIPIDNNVEGIPEVACLSESAKLAIQTAKPFSGNIYVKGQFRVQGCHLDFTNTNDQYVQRALNLQASRPTIIYEIPYRGCLVKRERTLNPPGLTFTVSVVVQFHHQFLTKVDRAYTITCFYMESTKTVTVGLDVSMLETTQLYQTRPMPVCTYDILRNGLNGSVMRFAQVGEMAYHKWSCLGAEGVYGILVHSCAAADGTGEEYKLIDSRGCAIDPVIVSDITYAPDLTMAYVEVYVFKFADKMQLSIQCQISLCLVYDGGCNSVTPPVCPARQVHAHGQTPTAKIARPPAIQPGNSPAIAPVRLYGYENSNASAPNPTSAFPPYAIFPTPPPSSSYPNGFRKRLKRNSVLDSFAEINNEKLDRFERTIDLASDDIYIFNMDEQMPPEGSFVGLNHSRPSINSIDSQTNSVCTSVTSFVLSLIAIALLFMSASGALILYQRRYYLRKLGPSACALQSNGFMT